MDHGPPALLQEAVTEQANEDEENESDQFTEPEDVYEGDIDLDDAPPQDIGSVNLQGSELEEDDIAEDDPVHDYEPSDTAESEEPGSETEDDDPTDEEFKGYKSLVGIQQAQKTGLNFSSNGGLRGTSVLACYVRHRIFEMFGPFDARGGPPNIQESTSRVLQFENHPIVLSGGVFSETGALLGPADRLIQGRACLGKPSNHPRSMVKLTLAVRLSRGDNWITLPALRKLIPTVLRYEPKEFEKPGQIRVSNQIRQPSYRDLLTKIYGNIYWLSLEEAAFVANQLLFERPGRALQLSSETLIKSRELSMHGSNLKRTSRRIQIEADPDSDKGELQQHPLTLGYASGTSVRNLGTELRLMIEAILSHFPQARSRNTPTEQVDDVEDFLGRPRRKPLELQP